MDASAIATVLLKSLAEADSQTTFGPLLLGIREVCRQSGIVVDRLQLPMTRRTGFRHPTLAAVVATWCDDQGFDESFVLSHDALDDRGGPPRATPYGALFESGERFFRRDLRTLPADSLPLLVELQQRGYVDYCAMWLELPGEQRQALSVASRAPFPADLQARLLALLPSISLAVYGAYRTSQARRLAQAYIGPESGLRVLAGDMRRGSTHHLTAGILFCDIRGFTAHSAKTSPEQVVEVVNELFTIVEAEAQGRGGEILKFIGDAMLLVFPVTGAPGEVARAMVEASRAASARVSASSLPVSVCFGGHLGDVIQGNIGTPERVDFTIMGSAVNLASRLESLCRPLDRVALFSAAVSEHVPELVSAGAHALKGFAEPIEVFGLAADGG